MISREEIKLKDTTEEIYVFVLKNKNNMSAKVTNYGGTLLSICCEDRYGKLEDVVLGHSDINEYSNINGYLGATVGRYANRIGNASITLEGKTYELFKNDGNNHLHGGKNGFNKAVWSSEIKSDEYDEYLELSYLSKDGEENYPGNLDVKVIYRLTDDNELVIEYHATTDKTTVVNLTNHAYFNLSGHNNGDILNHKVKIVSDSITEANAESIPTGEIRDIKNTPMDFREFKVVGKDIEADYDQLNFAKGYDHNYIVNEKMDGIKKIAEVVEDNTGRRMEVYTTMPGVQFYTGNFIGKDAKGKEGASYSKRSGLCLETQYYPDSLNNPSFPSPILKPNEKYEHKTIYKFSCI